MVRLNAAAGDERVGAGLQRVGSDELQLAHLVAAERKRQGIVALDQEPGAAAERPSQAAQLLDRGRMRASPSGERARGRHQRFSILA